MNTILHCHSPLFSKVMIGNAGIPNIHIIWV